MQKITMSEYLKIKENGYLRKKDVLKDELMYQVYDDEISQYLPGILILNRLHGDIFMVIKALKNLDGKMIIDYDRKDFYDSIKKMKKGKRNFYKKERDKLRIKNNELINELSNIKFKKIVDDFFYDRKIESLTEKVVDQKIYIRENTKDYNDMIKRENDIIAVWKKKIIKYESVMIISIIFNIYALLTFIFYLIEIYK